MPIARREFLKAATLLGPATIVLGDVGRALACDVAGRMPAHAPKPVLPALRYVTSVVARVTPDGIAYHEVLSLPAA